MSYQGGSTPSCYLSDTFCNVAKHETLKWVFTNNVEALPPRPSLVRGTSIDDDTDVDDHEFDHDDEIRRNRGTGE